MTNETRFSDFRSRLGYIISMSGVDKKIFAKQCGISENQIYNYLKRDQEPGTKFYRGLKSHYPQVSIDWLISGVGEPFLNTKNSLNSNALDMKHESIIKNFDDKEFAIEINQALVALERASIKEFYRIGGYIQAQAEQKARHSTDRRNNADDRRQGTKPYTGDERRMGGERRKAVGE